MKNKFLENENKIIINNYYSIFIIQIKKILIKINKSLKIKFNISI